MVHRYAKLPASVCQGATSRCYHVPCYPSLGAILCRVAHRKVPSCTELPIARCHCLPSCPSQGATACQVAHRKPLRAKFPSQGAIVWHVAHCKVPSCTKFIMLRCHRVATFPSASCHGGYCMVPQCAKFPISWSHRVPMFLMSRCHLVPMFPMSRCDRVPVSTIVYAPCCGQYCPWHGALPYAKGGYPMIPPCTKLPI